MLPLYRNYFLLKLRRWLQKAAAEVLSRPSVLTIDNRPAVIEVT